MATFLIVYLPLIALRQVLNHFLIFWELDSGHLRERRLWNTKEVSWGEITHVGLWSQSSNYVMIDHSRLAPMSDRGTIVANPEDHDGFLRALREIAPQADFEV